MVAIRALLFATCLAGNPAFAESPWIAIGIANPECTCRFRGADVSLGTQICLATSEGMRLAECVMEQNVTSWKAGPSLCPVAQERLFSPRKRG